MLLPCRFLVQRAHFRVRLVYDPDRLRHSAPLRKHSMCYVLKIEPLCPQQRRVQEQHLHRLNTPPSDQVSLSLFIQEPSEVHPAGCLQHSALPRR